MKKHLILPTYSFCQYCYFQTEVAGKQIRGYLLYTQSPAVPIRRHLWGGASIGFYFEKRGLWQHEVFIQERVTSSILIKHNPFNYL